MWVDPLRRNAPRIVRASALRVGVESADDLLGDVAGGPVEMQEREFAAGVFAPFVEEVVMPAASAAGVDGAGAGGGLAGGGRVADAGEVVDVGAGGGPAGFDEVEVAAHVADPVEGFAVTHGGRPRVRRPPGRRGG